MAAPTFYRTAFVLVAAFSATVGVISIKHLNSEITPDTKAYLVRAIIRHMNWMGARADEHQRTDGRLPTNDELDCDWKPCGVPHIRSWQVTPENKGAFSLTYYNVAALLVSGAPFQTTWHSSDGTTDRDGCDEPWRWRVDYWRRLVTSLAIILAPWAWLSWWLVRKRRRAAAAGPA